jgi:hypothetical protein
MTGSRSLNLISGDKLDVDKHLMEAVVHAEASMPEASASDTSKSTAKVPAKRDISQSFKTFAVWRGSVAIKCALPVRVPIKISS